MKMQKYVFVYVCDYDGKEPLLAVAKNIDDIPEDCKGQKIWEYKLVNDGILTVKREIDMCATAGNRHK